jgi:hypothetical protein
MRVTKRQIINGLADYIQKEVLPKMENEKAMQIVLSTLIRAVKSSDKLINACFNNDFVKAMLDDDGTGHYDITLLMDCIAASVDEYGALPIVAPPVPFLSPGSISLGFKKEDFAKISACIKSAVDD